MVLYADGDADLSQLKGKIIGVIGYGNQGSAQAKCLRDSGLNVLVGVREGGASWKRAEEDRLRVAGIAEAARESDVICMLVPDMVQREVYSKYIKKNLGEGKMLCFAHGFNITYGLIKPPKNVDVVMVAPKSTGARLREAFLQDEGVPGLIAVHQDYTGNAQRGALAIAKGLGLTRKGVFECTFDQETFSNLFAEQCVTIGGQLSLMKAGFETMVRNGIPPEIAYFECVGVAKTIMEMVERDGLKKTLYGVSRTATYGALTRGGRIVDEKARKSMQEIFDEVKDGSFAEEWLGEYEAGMKRFEELRRKGSDHPLEHFGAKMRKALGSKE